MALTIIIMSLHIRNRGKQDSQQLHHDDGVILDTCYIVKYLEITASIYCALIINLSKYHQSEALLDSDNFTKTIV